MYLFPLVGFFIGLIICLFVYFVSIYLSDAIFLGLLICMFILFVTGLHHTDALADVADGLMVHGDKEIRKKVMHDPSLGIAGVVTITFYIILITISISSLYTNYKESMYIFYVILTAEVVSKYSMVLQASLGKSSWEGSNTLFVTEMKNRYKLFISTLVTLFILFLVSFVFGFNFYFYTVYYLIISIVASMVILSIANKKFGGLSGDVLGTTNEITRLIVFIMAAFVFK